MLRCSKDIAPVMEELMTRLAQIALAGVLLAAVAGSPAQAQGLSGGFGQDHEASGMVILRIPFGTPGAASAKPELGLRLGAQSAQERQYRTKRYDARSGARVPTYDTDGVPTWKLERPTPGQSKAAQP